MNLSESEMPLDDDGNVYHLNLQPEELAHKIIMVGDPERVSFFSEHLDNVEIKKHNREITTHTGNYKGKRLSIISTGMGTDNIDIIMNELDALVNIDLKKRRLKEKHTVLEIVRIGTSGILQSNIKTNTCMASKYSIGIGCLMSYYENGCNLNELVADFTSKTGWPENMPKPFASSGSESLIKRIASDYIKGITITAPGFYGPQCRSLRLSPPKVNFIEKLHDSSFKGVAYTNLEMETSGIYGLGNLLGHKVLSLSIGIANRVNREFSNNYKDALLNVFMNVIENI